MRVKNGLDGVVQSGIAGIAVVVVGLSLVAGCSGTSGGTGGSPDMAIAPTTCVTDGQPIALATHYGVKVSLNVHVQVPANCTPGDGSCILETDTASKLLLLA